MNHLAHCFLSFNNEDLLIGNFIGDFIKGNTWKNYSRGVQHGIFLHRTIDAFTDEHPATRQSKGRIRSFAGRYAAAVTDILYDHLLTIHWNKYAREPFEAFAEKTYKQLGSRVGEMPDALKVRLPQMLKGQFLHDYTHREGLEWVLERFSRRMIDGMDATSLIELFFGKIEDFSSDFHSFFPDMINVARQRKEELAASDRSERDF